MNDIKEERKAKWNQFVKEYYELQEKYNVDLDFGCGCCANGHKMDGQHIECYKEGWEYL